MRVRLQVSLTPYYDSGTLNDLYSKFSSVSRGKVFKENGSYTYDFGFEPICIFIAFPGIDNCLYSVDSGVNWYLSATTDSWSGTVSCAPAADCRKPVPDDLPPR